MNKYRNLTLLMASTMTVMAGATISPSLPGMEKAFSNTPNAQLWVQMVMTIPGLVIAVAAPLMGWLLDVWKKKPVLIAAMLLYGVAGISGYFISESLMALMFSRLLLGVAVAGIMVGCTTLIGDYFPGPERGRYMGLVAAFGAFGGVVFVALASVLVRLGWQWPFLIYALVFVVLPMAVLFISEPEKANVKQTSEEASVKSPIKNFVILCFIMGFIEVFILYSIPVYFPFFAEQALSLNGTQAGLGIAFMLLAMALFSSTYQRFKKQHSFALIQSAGLLLVAIGFIGLAFVNHWAVAFMALALLGIGFGVIRPNLVMWLMSVTTIASRGRIMGGLASCFFIAQFVCPLLTQPLVATWHITGVFAALGCVALLIAAGLFIQLRLMQSNRFIQSRFIQSRFMQGRQTQEPTSAVSD